VHPNGFRINRLTNESLFKWIDEYTPSSEWLIDLTGGEPGMYPEIGTLVPELSRRGYHGVIRTNGTLPIPKDPNFIRVATWHAKTKNIPPYYDVIQILSPNPYDTTDAKIQYCIDNNIPYQAKKFIDYTKGEKDKGEYITEPLRLEGMLRITNVGMITNCYAAKGINGYSIFKMSKPRLIQFFDETCPMCHMAYDVERHIPKEWL